LPLWEKFLETGTSNILAYGTPQFFSSNGMYFRDVRVNSTEEVQHQGELRSLQKVMQRSLQPADIYTGVGETNGVDLVSQFFWGMSSSLKVARTQKVGWQDLKNSNLIFLSSMRFQTLAKELPYPSDFVINPGVQGTSPIYVRNPAKNRSIGVGRHLAWNRPIRLSRFGLGNCRIEG